MCGEDHGCWFFVSWDGCYRPFFFAFVEEIRPAMEGEPFFLFFGANTSGAVIRGVPWAFDVSPIFWGCNGVDFGEAVVDEGAINPCLVEDLL